MKKSLIVCLLLAIVSIMATGCSSCQSENKKQEVLGVKPDSAKVVLETAKAVLGDFYVEPASDNGQLVAERVIAVNRQWMWMNQGKDYVWFETEVEFEKSLKDSTQTGEIKKIRNVFQKVEKSGTGFDVTVWQTYTNKAGTVYKFDKDFWMEDFKLNEVPIKLTFKDAYNRLMETNVPKPDGKFCVFRMPVVPDSRPIYIFGNMHSDMVAVDAVTGRVSVYLGGPLGEWP